MVNYGSAMPPSRQVARDLRERIRSGDLPPGAKLPSINNLMGTYGIARNTAAKALRILADEQLIEIVRGWGSFVKEETPDPESDI
jgi:GntR family transcriptional regulator